MRKVWKYCFALALIAVLFLSLSMSASAAYEPDHTSTTEYHCAAADANRRLVVNCMDENGTLIKQVQFVTKRGNEYLAMINLNGYELIGFESDQGLWETCTLSWSSVNYVDHTRIFINYYFRTALSMDVITAKVTVRKSEPITITTRHYLRTDYSIEHNLRQFWMEEFDQCTVSYGDYFTSSAKTFPGHYLLTGTPTQIQGVSLPNGYPPFIGGRFSYDLIENAYGINDATSWMEWKVVNSTLKEENEDYTTYSISNDGAFAYCKNRVLYLDLYYDRTQCKITFSANGGQNAPGSMTQYYGFNIVIPSAIPWRSGYTFLGWSTDERASSASYVPGESYAVVESTTLYAAWVKDNYDFSVSELTIDRDKIYPNSVVTVRVRVDNLDSKNSYSDVPVELSYDGRLLATQNVNFSASGTAYVNFQLDVGTSTGEHEIQVKINRIECFLEVDQTNNQVQTRITVWKDLYSFHVSAVLPNASYVENTTVVTSFLISNNSELPIIPNTNVSASFSAYAYDQSGERVLLSEQTWNQVVIPIGERNLVYFKWSIPVDFAGRMIYCSCSINADGSLEEQNLEDNTATLCVTITERIYSTTPQSEYVPSLPDGYIEASPPTEKVGSASWKIWEYENGAFVLRQYGIKLSESLPMISPDSNCTTAIFDDGFWVIKSGYGIEMRYTPTVVSLPGYLLPDSDSYTNIQAVSVMFPEYAYAQEFGQYKTLEYIDGIWQFATSDDSEPISRLHFIPIWYPDKEYKVSLMATDLWTPAGCVSAVRNSCGITVSGSMYDDWYY